MLRLKNCKMTEEDINRAYAEATGETEPLLNDLLTFESMATSGMLKKEGDDVVIYADLG